jgi:PAS domain S-box-containing protein
LAVADDPTSRPKRRLFSSRREEIIEKQFNEIKALESKYRNLYEGAPDLYRTINTHGTIIDCNRAYFTVLGYSSKDEVIDRSIFEHTAEQSLNEMRASFEEWRRTGDVRNKEVWFKRKDGTTFPVLISATSLYDEGGNLIGSNSAIIDATEIYRARKQLERANEQLREAQKLKDEFINIAAHELRTPIHPILNYSELAERNLIDPKTALRTIKAQAERLTRLANNILDASRIESGTSKYDKRKQSINEIISEVVNFCKVAEISTEMKAGQRQITIDAKMAEDVELLVDKMKMTQALTNILQNAIKFTVQGNIAVKTRLSADKSWFEIMITDSGPGIPADIMPKLFGKFVTHAAGDNANKHGTGLGLFITKAIIEAHGGSISAHNNAKTKGATFVISLPVK